jgi:ABC-2 type transport system ATP-binding protein
MMKVIAAQGLEKRFGAGQVLAGLDLAVPEGSIYGLLGRNGAGKTTLLKLAMGLLSPTAGSIRIDSERIGYVAESGSLPDWMTARDLIRFERRLRPRLDVARLERLAGDAPMRALSKGQRKRLELELALAAEPEVLILDEPFDGLDPVTRAEAMEAVVQSGATMLISSHALTDLERLCDRVGVLAGGRIAFAAPLDELKESLAVVHGDEEPPVAGHVVASRARTWLVRDLAPAQADELRGRGYQLARPGLEELGTELIRCLDTKEGRA